MPLPAFTGTVQPMLTATTSGSILPHLRREYASRGAAVELQDLLIDLLRDNPWPLGASLPTEAQFAEETGLSKSTVRRALIRLQREGWIERYPGRGTFVGPRAMAGPSQGVAESALQDTPGVAVAVGTRLTRVAVVVTYIGQAQLDWYTPHLLNGFGEFAQAQPLAIEVLGHRENAPDAIGQRLEMTRPDALAVLNESPSAMWLIRDAQRLGIPVVAAGTPYRGMGLSVAYEDNMQGMRLAIHHLHGMGHRRIGLLIDHKPSAWVMERHAAFLAEMSRLGLSPDTVGVHWMPYVPNHNERQPVMDDLARYLGHKRPTAVVCGSAYPAKLLGQVAQQQGVRIPDDLSVVTFDQHHDAAGWLGQAPTTIELPLLEIGRNLATMAVGRVNATGAEPREAELPCRLIEGDTVRRLHTEPPQ